MRIFFVFAECIPLCIVSPSAVLIHRDVFDEIGGFDEALPACEDYDLWLRAALRYPIETLPESLTIKRGGARRSTFAAMGTRSLSGSCVAKDFTGSVIE